jgi:hypothetical protein
MISVNENSTDEMSVWFLDFIKNVDVDDEFTVTAGQAQWLIQNAQDTQDSTVIECPEDEDTSELDLIFTTFDDYENEPDKNQVVHTIKLKNQNGKVFYDKLTYLYLEMPNFKLQEEELATRLDKWLFFIKHLEDFQSIPAIIKDDVFTKAFEKAELALYNHADILSYEMNLKVYRDYKNTVDYAFVEGKMEGRVEKEIVYKWSVWKRYSEFEQLHKGIKQSLGWLLQKIDVPPAHTSVYDKFSTEFIEKRRDELNTYWQLILGIDKITEFHKHHCSHPCRPPQRQVRNRYVATLFRHGK